MAFSAWTTGHSVQVEFPDRLLPDAAGGSQRFGSGATFRQLNEPERDANRFHFAIPTVRQYPTAILLPVRRRVTRVTVLFETSQAHLTEVFLYGGSTLLWTDIGLDVQGVHMEQTAGVNSWAMPPESLPIVSYGLSVSVRIEFLQSNGLDFPLVTFWGAGVEMERQVVFPWM
jgi:hypothetical protein